MPSYVDSTGVTNLTTSIKNMADATYPSNAAIASAYDATAAYSVGDYCLRNGLLYKCNTAIGSGGEAWNSAHWTQTKASDEFGVGGSPFDSDIIADEYDSSSAYSIGDYCVYEGDLYKCNTAITVAESWTAAHWTIKNVTNAKFYYRYPMIWVKFSTFFIDVYIALEGFLFAYKLFNYIFIIFVFILGTIIYINIYIKIIYYTAFFTFILNHFI